MKVVYLSCRVFVNQCRLKILISDGIFYFPSNSTYAYIERLMIISI